MSVSFMDFLEELDVGDPLLVIGDDVLVFYTSEGVTVLEVAVGVLLNSFVTSHLHSGEVVSITRSIVGHLVVGHEEPGQCCPGCDALSWEIVEPQEWRFAHHEGEVSRHVVFVASEARVAMLYILSHILGLERPLYFSMTGLKSLGYLIVRRRRENVRKLLTLLGLLTGHRPSG
jgi:hypothetical protein